MMHGLGKSDPRNSSCEAGEQRGAIRRGVSGAKDGDQGKCGSAKHAPGSVPGKCVTGAGTHVRGARGNSRPLYVADRLANEHISLSSEENGEPLASLWRKSPCGRLGPVF